MDKQTVKLCGRGLGNLGYLLVLFLYCLVFMLVIKLQGLLAEVQIQEKKKIKANQESFHVGLIFF